jgi:hypothetical protein
MYKIFSGQLVGSSCGAGGALASVADSVHISSVGAAIASEFVDDDAIVSI